ncbi:TPA: zinc-ribbon domain-containing protein, partial [Methanosarcinaceae archaeon]|nr:zinc-ribbon domain-containing protein [Methanosarcinaceae archaeon]
MKCPECGAEVGVDDNFCGECGAKLRGEVEVKPETAAK